MKRMGKCRVLLVVLVGVMAFVLAPPAAQPASTVKTASSAMIDLQTGGDLMITSNEVWQFDSSAADDPLLAGFAGTQTITGPDSSCSGPGCPTADCNSVPSQPTANTAPTNAQLQGWLNDNKCTFWSGGTLTNVVYTKSVTNLSCGSGNTKVTYTYTWTYTVTPDPSSVGAKTAWNLLNSNSTDSHVNANGFVASESSQRRISGPNPGWSMKKSFTLTDSSGASRVTSLTLTVKRPDDTVLTGPIDLLDPTNLETADANGCRLDFTYNANTKVGETCQIVSGSSTTDIVNGTNGACAAFSCGGCDNFSGNDVSLTAGPTTCFGSGIDRHNYGTEVTIPASEVPANDSVTFKFIVDATVKGFTSTTPVQNVTVEHDVNISAGNCQ